MKKNYTLKTIAVLTLGTIAFTGLTAQAEDISTQPVNKYMLLKYWHVETGLPKSAEEIARIEGVSLEEAEKIVEELKAFKASSESSSSSENSSTEAPAPSSEETTTQPVNKYMLLKYWHVETGLPKSAEEIARIEGVSLEEAEKIVEELKAFKASGENSSVQIDSATEKNGTINSETNAIATPVTPNKSDAPASKTAQAKATTGKATLPNTGSKESVLGLIGTSMVLGIGLSQLTKRRKTR